MNNGK